MEPAEKDRNLPFSVNMLGLPGDNEVFAEEDEIWIKPKSSPLPRRRSSSSDEGSQPPLNLSRKVSFADAFGLELVSVREYDKWDVGSCSVGAGAQDERAPQDECLLLPLFELPSSPEQLMQKLYTQKVELESTEFPRGANCMKGLIRVLNISYEKLVYIRMTLNNWESYYDILADYVTDSCDGETDQFTFKILLVPPYLKDGAKVEFAIRYETQDDIYWANNDHKNYVILCHKKDDPIANEKPQEELDDRNLKSCLKTTYSKELLETSPDEGLTFLTSTEAQQENGRMILETKAVTQWNSEGHLNENREQQEVKREQLDPEMHPPLHISLTNSSSQEINLTQLEGLHCNVNVENEKNAAIISESPISQQKDLEEYHINLASTSNYVENKVKQDQESEWIGNSSNLETEDHGRDVNTAKTADGTDIATSTDNIMAQSSELFATNGAHSQQRRNETFISHGNDILTKSQLEINRPLGNNSHSPSSTDVQDNSVTIDNSVIIGRDGKLTTKTSNPTDLIQNFTGSENKSDEDNYLIGDSTLISASKSFPVFAVCTNTEPKHEPERISFSHNGSILSKERQVFSASIADPKELSQCCSETENLKAIKPEDFSTKPFSQNKEAESAQDQNPANRTEKIIPSMIQAPENDSTDKAVADVEKEDKGITQVAEQSTHVLSRILADTMVKEAIEAALFEITGDEGKTFTCESQKTKALSNNTEPSKHKVTKVLNLASRHGDPSKIHSIEEQNTRSCSQCGEHVMKTNTMHMQMEDASNTPQRNTEEETAPGVSLPAWTSPLVSEKAVRPDVDNSVEVLSVLQEKVRLPHELAGASEKVPGNISGFNCGLNQIHTEVEKQMDINLADLTGEEGHYKEKRIKNVKSVKVTQNCNISEIDYTHNNSVLDIKGSLELAKVDVEKEATSSIKDTLYDKTDKSEKFTQINNVTVVPQPAAGVMCTPDLTAEEKAIYEMSAECKKADQDSCEIDNETIAERERETRDTFSESVDYFENTEIVHDTLSFPVSRSTIQHAAKPKVGTRLGLNIYTINETKGKENRVSTLPQNSELNSQHKCLDQVKLTTTPVKENDGKETSTEVINDIYPNSEELKSKEYNEKPHKVEHMDEVCDSDAASIDSRLNSEPIGNEITLESTVGKVCSFVLFIVFLVTIYHCDFIGCFALYLFSLYWLYYEGETNSDPVRKD